MFGLEPVHIIVVLIVVLLFFGGTKVPQLMRGLGLGMGEFQKGLNESKKLMQTHLDEVKAEAERTPAQEESAPSKVPAPKEL